MDDFANMLPFLQAYYPVSNKLSAEAIPFLPPRPLRGDAMAFDPSVPYRRSLSPTAPVFVTSAALMATPPSSSQSPIETIGKIFGQPWNSDKGEDFFTGTLNAAGLSPTSSNLSVREVRRSESFSQKSSESGYAAHVKNVSSVNQHQAPSSPSGSYAMSEHEICQSVEDNPQYLVGGVGQVDHGVPAHYAGHFQTSEDDFSLNDAFDITSNYQDVSHLTNLDDLLDGNLYNVNGGHEFTDGEMSQRRDSHHSHTSSTFQYPTPFSQSEIPKQTDIYNDATGQVVTSIETGTPYHTSAANETSNANYTTFTNPFDPTFTNAGFNVVASNFNVTDDFTNPTFTDSDIIESYISTDPTDPFYLHGSGPVSGTAFTFNTDDTYSNHPDANIVNAASDAEDSEVNTVNTRNPKSGRNNITKIAHARGNARKNMSVQDSGVSKSKAPARKNSAGTKTMRTKVTQKTSVEQEEHYQVNESTDPYFLDPANFLDGELWEVVEIDPNDFFGQSINEKFKAANAIIAEQNKSDDPAGKMGQNIHIINADGRIKIEGVYWQSPQDDPSIPTTPAHRALRQQQILAALRNNKHCKEVATTKEFLNRWGADSAHFSDAELEDCAWDIVDACVDTHTHGWTKKILDVSLRESFQKTMFCTFDERMYGVIRTLMYAKRTCADILKQERFWTTLGNPFELDARTASNARSNRQKQMLIKKRTLEVAEGAGAGEGEGEGEGVGGRPKKRARASRL